MKDGSFISPLHRYGPTSGGSITTLTTMFGAGSRTGHSGVGVAFSRILEESVVRSLALFIMLLPKKMLQVPDIASSACRADNWIADSDSVASGDSSFLGAWKARALRLCSDRLLTAGHSLRLSDSTAGLLPVVGPNVRHLFRNNITINQIFCICSIAAVEALKDSLRSKDLWKRSPTQRSGRPPSSVDPQEPPGSIKVNSHQQPDVDTESTGLVGISLSQPDEHIFRHKSQSNAHPLTNPLPRPFALIIGINKYESPSIENLLGAVSDADAVRDYLQIHLGVPSSQIRILRDSEATRAAIIDGIKAFSFYDEIKVGDPILIYFAGHGGWAESPKGWEVGSPGQIELLIPYDHSSPVEGGNPMHGIPDLILGAMLSHLAGKKGDNITVILDCCRPGSVVHSGFARGVLRSHVLLTACRSQERACERTGRGLFIVALLKTLVDIGIDKLTYATLFDLWMPSLSSEQNPQCVGVNRNRIIFNGKASDKRTVYYNKIRKSEGEEAYVMPDAGEAAGITVGAEFEVYQDLYSGHLLGTVVAHKLSAFSTTLYANESRFALERDGVAFKSRAGTEEQVRIHVADESLKDLVKKIDPNERIIRLVERDHGAEFGIALENGKVVFNIYDPDVTKYGLTRMPYILEPTLEAISPVIRAAAHFYWHRRRTRQTGLAKKVEIEVTVLKQESIEYDDELNAVAVFGPTDWKGGKDFDLQTGTSYGWRIINKSVVPLYPSLFYFDNSDWSITPYYEPPIARGIVEPPLKGKGYPPLTVGYGDSGSVPHTFFLREGRNVDVGILKLFLSRKQVNLSHVAQSSPFQVDSDSTRLSSHGTVESLSRKLVNLSHVAQSSQFQVVSTPLSSRGRAEAVLPEPTNLPFPWDTVEIPVVQRRAVK